MEGLSEAELSTCAKKRERLFLDSRCALGTKRHSGEAGVPGCSGRRSKDR